MIYTVGVNAVDEQDTISLGDDGKLSTPAIRHDGTLSTGDAVWSRRCDAQKFLDRFRLSNCSVFGVLADWDDDTGHNIDESYRRLRRPAKIVALDP
jgi:hypothetical protein